MRCLVRIKRLTEQRGEFVRMGFFDLLCLYSGIKLDFRAGFDSKSLTITDAHTVLRDLIWHLHLASEQKRSVCLKCNDSGLAYLVLTAY